MWYIIYYSRLIHLLCHVRHFGHQIIMLMMFYSSVSPCLAIPLMENYFSYLAFHLLSLLKFSLGPIGRKFHGHDENDGFVLYEYIIKQCNTFCKYTNIRTSDFY